MPPTASFSQFACGVGFESVKYSAGSAGGRDDNVNVVGSDVSRIESPTAPFTGMVDGVLNQSPLSLIEFDGLVLEQTLIVLKPTVIRRNQRCAIAIVMAIN